MRQITDEIERRKRLSGDRFRQFRDTLRLTQGQLAETLGVTQTRVHYVEKGKQDLTLEDMWALARTYGLNPNFIMGLEDNMVNPHFKKMGKMGEREQLEDLKRYIKQHNLPMPSYLIDP